jgi:hypothetical protein
VLGAGAFVASGGVDVSGAVIHVKSSAFDLERPALAVYVDALCDFGWRIGGRRVRNCHLFCDQKDLAELHEMARRIGMQRQWFQDLPRAPHYDLTPERRAAAVAMGAIEVDRRTAVMIWRGRRALLEADLQCSSSTL